MAHHEREERAGNEADECDTNGTTDEGRHEPDDELEARVVSL